MTDHLKKSRAYFDRHFWAFLALLVVSAAAITSLARWDDRPGWLFGGVIGLSFAVANILGRIEERDRFRAQVRRIAVRHERDAA